MTDTSLGTRSQSWSAEERLAALTVLGLAALTLLRVAGLGLSQAELDFEEAQYWTWSLAPAFGYYSKPPLIAWIIGAAGSLCGSGEACIRLPAPLLWFGTTVLVFVLARRLYDVRTAAWTAALLALAPGVAFSARLMTTDVPLLFCWALALLALLRLKETGATRWAMLLGLAVGVGLLAKYAMVYFLACALVAAVLDRETRRVALSRQGLLALGIAALIFAPNLIWNAVNGFPTFTHTQDNVAGRGLRFEPDKWLAFFAGQLALIGPILFAALAARIAGWGRNRLSEADRFLLAFSAPVLVVLALYALMTPANANWAAVAYVAGVPLATAVLVRLGRPMLLKLSLAIGLVAQLGLLAGDALAPRIGLPFYPRHDPYARVQGWARLGHEIEAFARRTGVSTLAIARRSEVALFSYYLRGAGIEVVAWPWGAHPTNHYEWTRPLGGASPVLFLWPERMRDALATAYAEVTEFGNVTVPTGPTTTRSLQVYRLAEPRGVKPFGAVVGSAAQP